MKNLSQIKITANTQRGQVVLVTVLFFLFISLSIVLGFGSAMVKNFKNTEDFVRSKQSYFTAESGLEDAVYRLTTGKTTAASMNLSLNGASTVTTITPSGAGNEIVSLGDYGSLNRKVRTVLNPTSTGASYGYGIQVGSGGFTLGNSGSGVTGNVYVNGDIFGGVQSGQSFVTGTAVAVNKVPVDIEQENLLPVTPPSSIDFHRSSGAVDFAQSFTPSTTTAIKNVFFYIKRTGSPTINNIYIMSNDGSNRPGSILATGSFDSVLTTSYKWNNVTFTSNPTLTKDVIYWIVIDVNGSSSGSNYCTVAANTSVYTRGDSRTMTYNTAWNATTTKDAYFQVSMGGTGSTIDKMVIGGDAVAYTVTNSTVTGTIYCRIGSGNNKACTATSTDPIVRDFTITQAQIDEWKAVAAAGVPTAGYNIPQNSSVSLGPTKIEGDLTSGNNVVMTVTGTLWITGNYAPGGGTGQKVKLDSTYGANSGVIIVDGEVDLSNNIPFEGSGDPDSFILLITTSSSANAVTVGNNAGAVLLEAPNGTIHFNNNAGAKESTANRIELANGATVTYDTGLVDAHFSNGPSSSGGISGWREVQ